ncbi:TonB-dependent receptor plug domain-containing protein [Massilia sp. GCM10020059]|uniref:TonB-dependent receptor n=1 Tax=Massilia agrisoli TaxID=2892444 RepID=A0ABS8IV68_9BURK|nr:TonB-dependent receptor [Massilia agrisoli]MCC6072532.1 TonB-dependent receptor [Massilia agrisoli]
MTLPVARRAALSSLALALSSPFLPAHAGDAMVAEVLVTANRSTQPAMDVLSDHVVIGSDDIARSGARSVTDLLQLQRGIEVARNGGPGATSSVFIRGADNRQNVVLVDGVRIGSSTTGGASWSALPLADIERIEIVYGPLATMYGADALGGVVQIFTRRGAGAPRVTFAARAGSEGLREGEAAVSGSTASAIPVSYAIATSRTKEDGFSATRPGAFSFNPDRDGYNKESASGQLALQPARGHELGALFMHSRLDADYDAGAADYPARSVQQLDNVALFSRHQLSAAWQLALQASSASDKSQDDSSAAASGRNRIETRQNALSVQNDIAIGDDLLQLVLERRSEEVISNSSGALNRRRDTDSAAASYSLRAGAHLASISARSDDSSQYGSNTTWGLGYGYRLTRTLRLNASTGTSFRAPTFNELYYPGYGVESNRPEQGRNVEAGAYFSEGENQASIAWYRNKVRDLLVSTSRCPVEVATHPYGCAYNVNRVVLSGVSIGMRTRLADIDLNAAFDFQDPRDDTTGKQLARRARRHAKLGAEYAIGSSTVGAEVLASGARYDDAANRNGIGGYGVVNLFAGYRLTPDWSAILRWNNVADKRYELARHYATPGSNWFAGLRYGAR